ncbi:Serine/threonine-protein kinase EDR1 [Galdieria sulphuraria]|nr:Serine/threonine-protein kinase EDR1 [Galdieria sulphuraria]
MTLRGREKRSKSVERTKEDSRESLFGRFTFFRNCNRQCKDNSKSTNEVKFQNNGLEEQNTQAQQPQLSPSIPVTRSNRRRHEAIEDTYNNWDSKILENSLSSSYPGHNSPRSLSPEPYSSVLHRSYPKNNNVLSKRVSYNIGNGIRNLSALISGTPGRFAETMSGIRASSSSELSKLTSSSVSDAFSRDFGELSKSFNGLDSPICITPRIEGSQSSLSEKSDVNFKFEISPVSSRTVTQTGSISSRSIINARNSACEKVVDNEIQMASNNEGIEQLDFLTVHRGDGKTQIELHRGRIDKLSRRDRVDYLLVARASNLENSDPLESTQVFDCSNVLEAHGLNIEKIQQLSKDLKSFRKSYHCWISCKLQKEKLNPPGFEYERMLFHDTKSGNVEPLFQIVLDTFRCLAALIAYNMTAKSILIPLCGGDLYRCKNYRVDALKAILEVATVYAACGLPLRSIKILLPENTSIESERRHFARAREEWHNFDNHPIVLEKMERKNFLYDCLLLHGKSEMKQIEIIKDSLQDMKASSQSIDCVASVHSGANSIQIFKSLSSLVFSSRKIVALISPNFMECLCCQMLFSLAFCRNLESKGNALLPIVLDNCPMSPLVKRVVNCQGVIAGSQKIDIILRAICKFVSSEVNSSERKNDKVGTIRLHSGEIVEKKWEDETTRELNGHHQQMKEEEDLCRNEQWQYFETNNLNDFEFEDDESILSNPLFTLSSLPEWKSRWNIDPRMLEVGPRIGVGGSGEVFKATYQRQVVAVKLLVQDEDHTSSDALLDFKGEMLLMSGLSHPNIVKFIGAVNSSTNICLVTEFVSGGCLYRYIARKRANGEIFPMKDYLKIALDIAKGMEYLHAQTPRVIHMDLKSPNILLSPHNNGYTAKIADFGLSCRLDKGLRNTGFGGTAEWMAPEMMRQEKFDEKVDVFSFGVILWELVTGEKPWGNDHPTHIIRKVSLEGQRLIVPLDIRQRIPKEVDDLIDQCQSAIPVQRPSFSDCVQVLTDLCFRES